VGEGEAWFDVVEEGKGEDEYGQGPNAEGCGSHRW
jgi:hypothetical protein